MRTKKSKGVEEESLSLYISGAQRMTNAPTAGCKLLQCVNAHTDKTLALEAGFVFHPSGVCLHE